MSQMLGPVFFVHKKPLKNFFSEKPSFFLQPKIRFLSGHLCKANRRRHKKRDF